MKSIVIHRTIDTNTRSKQKDSCLSRDLSDRKHESKESSLMTRIPEDDRNILELAIYLPMVLTILNRDMQVVTSSPFKLKRPYLELIEETMKTIQAELARVRRYMRNNKMKVEKIQTDDAFTMYMFLYKGYEEHHNYFNPRLRNRVEELLRHYLFQRFLSPGKDSTKEA